MKFNSGKSKENALEKEKTKHSKGDMFISKKLQKSNDKISIIEDEERAEKEGQNISEYKKWETVEVDTEYQDIHSDKYYEYYKITKNNLWWVVFLALTALGIVTRLHYITYPNEVVWDETHFGKMAGWYLNRTFFFDVHPPGGKMLVALFGYMSGYNASHSFSAPGESYEGYEGIIYMRVGCALFGAGMIPLAFLTVWELTTSLMASAFAGLLCCYEIGWISLSKFILLDPILMFFMMASFHALCMFHRQMERPWKKRWWLALAYNGVALGCTLSVKFVGVFIILAVGSYTILDLWRLFSDIKNSLLQTLKHFLARCIFLILVPLLVYVGIFFIHDQILINTSYIGSIEIGTGLYTPAFQKRLINSSLHEIRQPAEASYGSVVTVRNDNLGAGYLHSHNFTYPSKYVTGNLQQITFLPHKDQNNYFRLLFPFDDPDTTEGFYSDEVETVLNGNWVRLLHVLTNATLACHRNKSIIATKMTLVYGRAYNLTDPAVQPFLPEDSSPFMWDIWMVKTENGLKNEPVRTLDTRFQLIHPQIRCALVWSKEKLPNSWGFSQGEASCTKNLQDPLTFLLIETVDNPNAPNATFDNLTIGFVERLVESHRVMQFTNARLTPSGTIELMDRPWMWPLLYRGHPWYDMKFRIVLLGNPLIFLLNFMSLMVTPILLFAHCYRRCRNPGESAPEKRADTTDEMSHEQFIFALKWIMIVYLFNYLPFYFMNRILYFHHYFPSQSFACLLTAVLLARFLKGFSSYFSEERRTEILRGCVAFTTLLLTLSFLIYCYVAYGVPTNAGFNPNNSTFRRFRFNEDWLI